jgi:hypothetical protein
VLPNVIEYSADTAEPYMFYCHLIEEFTLMHQIVIVL